LYDLPLIDLQRQPARLQIAWLADRVGEALEPFPRQMLRDATVAWRI